MARFVGAIVLGGALATVAVSGQTAQTVTDVTVTGEVLAPGRAIPARQLSVSAAIAGAGGFSADAVVVEIRHRSSGTGPVTAATPSAEYRAQYVLRADLANGADKDPILAAGDLVIVRRSLEIHPPIPSGQFGAGAMRLDYATWGVSAPVVLTSREPEYTRAGMLLKLQGKVRLEAVVNADGTVADARVVDGLEARRSALVAELKRLGGQHELYVLQELGDGPIGLDTNAIACVKTWSFTPGTILGKPTAIVHDVSVDFKLH
jgi:hypothetical protein